MVIDAWSNADRKITGSNNTNPVCVNISHSIVTLSSKYEGTSQCHTVSLASMMPRSLFIRGLTSFNIVSLWNTTFRQTVAKHLLALSSELITLQISHFSYDITHSASSPLKPMATVLDWQMGCHRCCSTIEPHSMGWHSTHINSNTDISSVQNWFHTILWIIIKRIHIILIYHSNKTNTYHTDIPFERIHMPSLRSICHCQSLTKTISYHFVFWR